MNRRRNLQAVLLVLLGAASYGLLSPVFKLGISDGWDAYSLTFVQLLTGALMLWGILLIKSRLRPSLRMKARVWLKLCVTGAIGMALTSLLFNRALTRLDASLSIVLLFQYAWITILLESFRMRRWPVRSEWLSVVLIFLGTLLAVGLLERDLARLDVAGIVYGLLSAVTYALFFFMSGFLPRELEPFAKSAVMATASITFIIVVQGTGPLSGGGNLPLIVWGVLLGLLGTALPTLCFNAGIPKIGAGFAALLGSLELPVTVVAAYLLLGEPLSWWQGAGIALILAGIAATQSKAGGTAGIRPGNEE